MKAFPKVAFAVVVTMVAIGAQAFAAENVRYKGEVKDFFRVALADVNRKEGPNDARNNARLTRIDQYKTDVAFATLTFFLAQNEHFKEYEKIILDSSKTQDEVNEARKQYVEKIADVKNQWRQDEQKAYDKLIKDIITDHKNARDSRASDYRNLRRRITYYLKLSATSKSKPGGGRSYSYTHIPEDDIAIPKVSSYGGLVDVEWEIADVECLDSNSFSLRGIKLDRQNVYFVPDTNMVGIRIDFQMDGGDYSPRDSYWQTCECDPWCEFRPTQAWSERQADKDMGFSSGDTDEALKKNIEAAEKFLEAAETKFERAKEPWM